MSAFASVAYSGTVVHKRLSPKTHAFSYRVFSMCLDVDEIDGLDRRLRLFSRNAWNLLSFYDADHGAGTDAAIGGHVRRLLADANLAEAGAHIQLLCYPRLLGFVFNPLSVYFCHDRDGRLAAIVYEVSNTFRERKSYVIPVARGSGPLIAQKCAKEMYVSPFTAAQGCYEFHIQPPGERIVVGVDLRGPDGPVLKTHFRGVRHQLSDKSILGLVARHPLMTLKVVGGIHLEALRLWLKGVPLVERHTSPRYSFTVVNPVSRDVPHVQQ